MRTTNGLLDRIDLDIQLTGPITPGQHTRLMEIAEKCPVHRTLKSEIDIQLHAAPSPLIRIGDSFSCEQIDVVQEGRIVKLEAQVEVIGRIADPSIRKVSFLLDR